MKILHIVPVYFPEGPGGIQVHVQGLSRAQAAAGHQVTVLAGSLVTRDTPALVEELVDGQRVLRLFRDDLHHLHYARGHHGGASRLIRASLAAEQPDIVHVHQWVALSDDLVATAEDLGLATVVSLHDFLISCPRCYRQDFEGQACLKPLSLAACGPCVPRLGGEGAAEIELGLELFRDSLAAELARARLVWTLTPGAIALFERLAKVAPGRLQAQPLGYRLHAPAGSLHLPLEPRPGEPLRFAQWGRLGWHKGSDVLLEAFAQLCRRPGLPPAELHFLGAIDPPDYNQRLRQRAYGLPVFFHGPFEFADLSRLAPHVACFPTRCLETHGFVLDEARELGLPLCAADLGAYGERTGPDGLRLPPEDSSAWAQALERLLCDPDLRRALVAKAPPLPISPEAQAAAVEAGYRQALALPPGPRPDPTELPARRARLEALQRASKPWLFARGG